GRGGGGGGVGGGLGGKGGKGVGCPYGRIRPPRGAGEYTSPQSRPVELVTELQVGRPLDYEDQRVGRRHVQRVVERRFRIGRTVQGHLVTQLPGGQSEMVKVLGASPVLIRVVDKQQAHFCAP